MYIYIYIYIWEILKMVNLSLHHGFSVIQVAMVLQASGSFLVGLAAHGQLLGSGTGDFSPLRGQGG
jgi:hypothetical protein